ncbi:hypothetical protein N7478_003789 [Penicillium angulare]|uniref:uncharacterized protein n=1 Tax=Penicillium angulare TaxID=116970 RepID=UPI0025421958|nr:uncharacterized protein N7478_003789 [Penicillium angulare]KAJ5288103.1 hypothetical protein N7478_003789 [Penicillium angulare]
MAPHSTVGWSTWEEENLLPWLESNRYLTWNALSHAYWQQYQIRRSAESLRGKRYHILRKRRDAGHTPIKNKRQPTTCEHRKLLVKGRKKNPLKRRIRRWLRNVSTGQSDRSDSTGTKRSSTGKTSPNVSTTYQADQLVGLEVVPSGSAQLDYARNLSWIWDYAHRLGAAGKLAL